MPALSGGLDRGGKDPGMKIDVGEGTGAPGEDHLGFSVTRSEPVGSEPNRAVALQQQQQQARLGSGEGREAEMGGRGDGAGTTLLNCAPDGEGPHSDNSYDSSNKLPLAVVDGRNRVVDGSANIGSENCQVRPLVCIFSRGSQWGRGANQVARSSLSFSRGRDISLFFLLFGLIVHHSRAKEDVSKCAAQEE